MQDPNRIPSDIVFRVKYKEHPRFSREGNDLVHMAKISLADALSGCIVELLMLDDRTLNIPVSDVVCPGYQLRVPSEGMPLTKGGGKGDLVSCSVLVSQEIALESAVESFKTFVKRDDPS
jgi:DnaJ-class molecular chaperone